MISHSRRPGYNDDRMGATMPVVSDDVLTWQQAKRMALACGLVGVVGVFLLFSTF